MKQLQRIPFTSLGKNGVLEVRCEPNRGPDECGLNLILDLEGDLDLCVGYPVMEAEIVEFEGVGYGTACSWIQVVNDKFYDEAGTLALEDDEVDVISSKNRKIGNPFFAQGFLPQVYDAPCFNLQDFRKLDWTAHMFLVSTPSRMNKHKIQFLAGFEWGYIEQRNSDGIIEVTIKDMMALSPDDWKRSVKILRNDYGIWDYEV